MRILLSLCIFTLAACGSEEASKTTTIGGTSIIENQQDGTVTIRNTKGSMKTLEGAATANVAFPSYAPKYPGSNVENVLESESKAKGAKTLLSFSTSDAPSKVGAFYKAQFEKAGLKLTSKIITDETVMVGAEVGERTALILAGSEGTTTKATLSFPR